MKKVYQIEKNDCMRAVLCSLFDIEDITTVPNFIEYENSRKMIANFVYERGYKLSTMSLLNKNWCRMMNPGEGCFKPEKFYNKTILTRNKIKKLEGVNGYFFASVFSPKYSSVHNGYLNTHAIIIDKDFNVIHDPNIEYKDILKYPLSKLLGLNGIYCVEIIEPINSYNKLF